jgi:hypothetical protein
VKIALTVVIVFIGLAVGCTVWLGFFSDKHDYSRKLTTEDRRAVAVGANPLPITPVQIIIKPRRKECVILDKVEFDGADLFVNYHMGCAETYSALRWKQRAPDGTIIDSGEQYIIAGSMINRGEKGEWKTEYLFHLDPRTVTVEVTASRED